VPASAPYPVIPCIAETNKYAPAVPQHFFVWLGRDNLIWDALDGKEKVNTYPLVSFRLFDPKPAAPTVLTEADKAFLFLKDINVYSTFTQRNSPVTTDQLAQFLQRFDEYVNKKYIIN
jgi:hypothetical protein